jgi:MYXO-CTERM domain-containing protein
MPPTVLGHALETGRREGSYVHYHDGSYYLFWNEGSCCDGTASTYTIWVARSQGSITGPYSGNRVFYASNGNINGPGHMGVYSACGVERFTYHSYPTATSVLGENELAWSSDDWPVAGAVSTTPLTPCGNPGSGGSGDGGVAGAGGTGGAGGAGRGGSVGTGGTAGSPGGHGGGAAGGSGGSPTGSASGGGGGPSSTGSGGVPTGGVGGATATGGAGITDGAAGQPASSGTGGATVRSGGNSGCACGVGDPPGVGDLTAVGMLSLLGALVWRRRRKLRVEAAVPAAAIDRRYR